MSEAFKPKNEKVEFVAKLHCPSYPYVRIAVPKRVADKYGLYEWYKQGSPVKVVLEKAETE